MTHTTRFGMTALLVIAAFAAPAAADFVVENITPGNFNSVGRMAVFNNELHISASTDDEGFELWKYDGNTFASAAIIRPGNASSGPDFLTTVNGELLFVATDGTYGRELWKYDGTNATMVADIRQGMSESFITTPIAFAHISHLTLAKLRDWASKPPV